MHLSKSYGSTNALCNSPRLYCDVLHPDAAARVQRAFLLITSQYNNCFNFAKWANDSDLCLQVGKTSVLL